MPGFGLGGTVTDKLGTKLDGTAVAIPPGTNSVGLAGITDVKNYVSGARQNGTSTNGTIKQTERLFTVRPRSLAGEVADQTQNLGTPNKVGYVNNRGPSSKIRLLTNDPSRNTNFDSSIDLSITTLPADILAMQTDAGYTNFLLTDVQVGYSEKVQVMEVFGDSEVAYYFGKSPVVFTLSGLLFDDIDNDWFTKFQRLYTNVMRGTELARRYELIQVVLPNMEIIGSAMNMSYSQNSQRDTDIPFSFQVLAKVITPRVMVVPAAQLSNDAVFIDFGRADNFTGFTDQSQINSLKEQTAKAKKALQDPSSSSSLIASYMSKLKIGLGDTVGANTSTTRATAEARGATLPTLGGDFGIGAGGTATTLTGFRASIFSPVYGILSTITKVVKDTTGDISLLISQFTNPVNTILKDIRNVSAEAVNVVNTIENSINNIINIPLQTIKQIQQTIKVLKNTAGVISRVPETISDILKRLTKSGRISPTGAFLTGSNGNKNKTALLNSGSGYTAKRGAFL